MPRSLFDRNHVHIDNLHDVRRAAVAVSITKDKDCRLRVGVTVFYGEFNPEIANAPHCIRAVEHRIHVDRISRDIDIQGINDKAAGNHQVFQGKARPFGTDIAIGNRRDCPFTDSNRI